MDEVYCRRKFFREPLHSSIANVRPPSSPLLSSFPLPLLSPWRAFGDYSKVAWNGSKIPNRMGRHRCDSCGDSSLSESGVSRKPRLNKLRFEGMTPRFHRAAARFSSLSRQFFSLSLSRAPFIISYRRRWLEMIRSTILIFHLDFVSRSSSCSIEKAIRICKLLLADRHVILLLLVAFRGWLKLKLI